MENISDIIKEAKPLYLARKRRNNVLKSVAGVAACTVFLFLAVPQKQPTYDGSYFWNLGYTEPYSTSYVENLGLPVDDYGLLLVS